MSIESRLIEALRRITPVFLRLVLGGAFLSAAADRFGLWGPAGTRNASWGDFAHFVEYTAQLNPWAPAALIPMLAWVSTGAELVLGVLLILGLFTRFSALMGTLMMIFFFFAAWEFEFGIVNQHLTYAVVTFGLAVVGAGNYLGLDAVVGPMFGERFRYWLMSGQPRGEMPGAA